MAARSHSRAVRLAAAFLARQAGVDAAASAFRVDPRTVKRWADAGELPDTEWAAIEAVLLARVAEQSARPGADTRGLVALSTAAGIASRNRRYATLIARREARSTDWDAGAADYRPHGEAIDGLRDDQKALASEVLRLELRRRQATDPAEPPAAVSEEQVDIELAAWLAEVATLSEEEVVAERASVAERLAAIVPTRLIEPDTPEAFRADLAEPVAGSPEPTRPEPTPTTIVLGGDGTWRPLHRIDLG